jgi:hypothetical protein
MQLSVKTPPELSLPLLEKCAICDERSPSSFLQNCVWQCIRMMESPHREFHPLEIVENYYLALGREDELHLKVPAAGIGILRQLAVQDRAKRAAEAAQRLKQFRAQLKQKPAPKHLHLKISEGSDNLPQRVKAKAEWLRMTPNALVMSCLRDCLGAMAYPHIARATPATVIHFWVISHAKSRPKPKGIEERMWFEGLTGILRRREGPIFDTIVRLVLAEKWEATLEQILREADVISKDRVMKE